MVGQRNKEGSRRKLEEGGTFVRKGREIICIRVGGEDEEGASILSGRGAGNGKKRDENTTEDD